MKPLSPPTLLTDEQDLSDFQSGEIDMDLWLQRRALKNMMLDATRVYVVCEVESQKPIGYYGLSASSITISDVKGSMRRNMPDPIPCLLLGRLAVHETAQGYGIGKALLADCIERATKLSVAVGARLLLTHPISDQVSTFYQGFGFVELPTSSATLALDLNKVKKLII